MAEMDEIRKIANDFFEKLEVKADLEVEEENEEVVISVTGEELGILIGYHGETLESLQLLISLIINKQLGKEDWQRIRVDVGGWKKEKEEGLKRMVEDAVKKVTETGNPVSLPPMSASQRRFIHVLLQEKEGIEAASEDVEPYRHIVISVRN